MEAIATGSSRARFLQAFKSRDFRLLWTGQAISLLGDTAFVVALGWRTFTLTGSARSLAIVLTLQGLGLLSTVLLGGALADRYDRRTLMLVSDAARFGVIGALAFVDASGHLSLGILAGLAFAEGLATGFFTPALGGLVPLVVEQPGLGSANALIGMARQASLLIGPTFAGLMYGFAGSTVVFGFNAFSYLISFGFVFATRPRVAERAESVGTLREIWAGIRYVTAIPWLWVTITLFAFVLMFQWAPIQVLTPKLVRNHFHLSVGAYGVIFSMLGAGMIVGAITFAQMNPRRRRGLISYLIWMLNSLLIVVFALSPWYSLALVASFCRGICIGYGVAVWETMLMELVPQNMLSRVVSLDWFGAFGLTPFGLLAAGAVSHYFSAGTIIAAGAVISMCLVGAGLLSRQIREID
ncbi:MAG TPA: MFS transporter [Gaiellaceae bacterium]|jgi:MFS family permease|nr:MFS transporter [Gaiellaceae bacterium]